MNAFRLKTIAPGSAPGARMSAHDRLLERIREEAYNSGFVAGQAAATEAHVADQARLTSELVEAMHDACMTNEAARRHVAASFAPVMCALVEAITPALAEAGLAEEIAKLVDRAIDAAPEAEPRLRCAPELAPVLRELFAGRERRVTVEEAPEMLPREARLYWDQGFDQLDLDACVAQVRACLASVMPSEQGDEENDERRFG